MNNSMYEHVENTQKSIDTCSAPFQTTGENVHFSNVAQNTSSDNVNMTGINANNEIHYVSEPVDTSRFSYIPHTTVDNTTIKLEDNPIVPSYDYTYEQNNIDSKTLYPETYDYTHLGKHSLDTNPQIPIDKPYNLNDNVTWENGYPLHTEHQNFVNGEPRINDLNKTYNINYTPKFNMTDALPTHKTSVHFNQIGIPLHTQTNVTSYDRQPNNVSYSKHNTTPYFKPNVIPYEQNGMKSYASPISPRQTTCKMNQLSEINPIFRKRNRSVCNPNAIMKYKNYPQDMNCRVIPSPYIQYDPRRPIVPMSVNSPQPYFIVQEKDKRCFLQKGIDCAMNKCELDNSAANLSNYEYVLKGLDGAPMGTFLSNVPFDNKKKFDMFKKITLKVGTCLDEIVNVFVESLHSSIEALHANNEMKLHDVYPFYNPDPVYTRPERPTLKTGNNIIDQINHALDGSTLEKHKTVPKNMRIPIPKTVKTGHLVVDGINSILDNLLNEPISYQKYDYYTDKVDTLSKSNQRSELSYDRK